MLHIVPDRHNSTLLCETALPLPETMIKIAHIDEVLIVDAR